VLAANLRTQVRIARMLNYLNEEHYILINEKASLILKQLVGFIKYLKQYESNK
jgi:hypothetical protein